MRKNRSYRILGCVLGFMLIALLLYRCGLGLRETSECYLGEPEYFSILQWNGVIFGEDSRSETASLPKGEAVGQIKYTKADHKCPRKTLRDGDATLLDVGTTLYRVEGYKETARLWAGDRLFLANSNPQAETVNDLLDIAGKIETVRFISGMDGKTSLKDFTPEAAAIFIEEYPKLKNMTYDEISKLPKGTVGYDYWLELGLNDGTAIILTYSPMRKAFQPGGLATPELAELVEQQRKRIYAK